MYVPKTIVQPEQLYYFSTSERTKKHNFSSNHPAHQSRSDHFERVLHCDISGRGSCVTHGRSVWRELGGDVIQILGVFFGLLLLV